MDAVVRLSPTSLDHAAARPALSPQMRDSFRQYLALVRSLSEHSISDEMRETVEADFPAQRAKQPSFNQTDFHRWLTVSR
jgi:hypothetical protein